MMIQKIKLLLTELQQLLVSSSRQELSLGDQKEYSPIRFVRIASGVGQTLVNGYMEHLAGDRKNEEIGWLLLGFREKDKAIILAAIPSGESRDASSVHVKFNSQAQAIAGRILKKREKKLEVLGLFHTHPGKMRRPSSGDFRGDIEWVKSISGRQGIFGIGTVENATESYEKSHVANFVSSNAFDWNNLRFSWYSLLQGDTDYKNVKIRWTLGPDLADFLSGHWSILEKNAEAIERILSQQNGSTCDVISYQGEKAFCLLVPTTYPKGVIRAFILGENVKYFFENSEQQFAIDVEENNVDRGIYLVLAELGKK